MACGALRRLRLTRVALACPTSVETKPSWLRLQWGGGEAGHADALVIGSHLSVRPLSAGRSDENQRRTLRPEGGRAGDAAILRAGVPGLGGRAIGSHVSAAGGRVSTRARIEALRSELNILWSDSTPHETPSE